MTQEMRYYVDISGRNKYSALQVEITKPKSDLMQRVVIIGGGQASVAQPQTNVENGPCSA